MASFFLLLLLVLLNHPFPPSISDPRTLTASIYCGTGKLPANTNFIPTFVKEMETLSQLVTIHHFGTHILNSTPPMYGLAQCYQDLSHTDCLLCYAAARTKLPRCLPSISARIYLDGCFLRYDNYSFFNEYVDQRHYNSVNCSTRVDSVTEKNAKPDFKTSVGWVIQNVTRLAVENGGFRVAEVNRETETVYALAQCWKTISKDGCRDCLDKAGHRARGCAPAKEGRGFDAGCYIRYSTEKFYNDGNETNGQAGYSGIGMIVTVVLVLLAGFMMLLFAAFVGYTRVTRMKQERKIVGRVSSTLSKSSLYFKYEVLEKATGYFDPSRKLGQGGAGSVFMGTLPDGTRVAVKRLFFNTRQWVDEFFNEVNLIGGIQHKNLVKLLGCSIEGPESLLVYEYVPKRSLDQFIFEKNRVQILSWHQRYEIIVGTAEGLAYLHEGCAVRIIHRDIKSSNVLLDENFNPKVADFGLARCFATDKSHLSTGIAGTLGYMAPEYLVRGQLTEKADVYSFGVLVLEIVCGRKNTDAFQDSGSLPQTSLYYLRVLFVILNQAWRFYKFQTLHEIADPCLRDNLEAKEASNVLQIGLLCTQALATLRPSMAEVVQMLKNRECEIPSPSQPPFLNTNGLEGSCQSTSCCLNIIASNASTTEASSTSENSSSMHSSDKQTRSKEFMQNDLHYNLSV
ncbi:Protein kinase domain [Dillenia turbinata]|uniref:Protein kinase domain n=1 Tax=Dillenia turbinata TaxID=194707 RepID=A0AAN8Z867_9MAGN